MKPQGVIIVSHRHHFRVHLALLLSRLAAVDNEERWPPSGDPAVLLVDATALLAPFPNNCLSLLRSSSVRVFVLGHRADADPIITLLNEGIPVYLLEHLAAGVLLEMVKGALLEEPLYSQIGWLSARRVSSFLAARRTTPDLSPREERVLDMVRQGHTNLRIAQALGIEVKTVKNHLTRVYNKLGVSGRYEAISTHLSTDTRSRSA